MSARVETDQQMFDAAWTGLKKQGFVKCITSFSSSSERWNPSALCAWADTDGRRCAIGHSNEKYRGDAYTYPAVSMFDEFISDLRACHNTATSPQDMERQLREFAVAHVLTIPGERDPFKTFMEKVREPILTPMEEASMKLDGEAMAPR